MEKKPQKKEYTIKEYQCGYCTYSFRACVRKALGNVEVGYEKPKHNVSSQVQCPHCHNFLKTWDEGKVIEVVEKRVRFNYT